MRQASPATTAVGPGLNYRRAADPATTLHARAVCPVTALHSARFTVDKTDRLRHVHTRPSVAVAIVSWNTRELLRACLASVAQDAERGLAEVWVVDNGSSDGSPELVRESFPWAQLIADVGNVGYGAAVNLVAKRTASRWIVAANADVELTADALSTLVRVGELRHSVGIVAPRLVLPDGSIEHSVFPFPTVPFTITFNLGLPRWVPGLGNRLCLEHLWDHRVERSVDWAVGAFLMIRRATWERLGGFDEKQWMYAEDLDLGWRAHQAGWQTRYVPSAVVRHHKSASVSQVWGEDVAPRTQRSTYEWMTRRRGAPITRVVAFTNFIGALVRAVLMAPLAFVDGRRWGWRRDHWRRWARIHSAGLSVRGKRGDN